MIFSLVYVFLNFLLPIPFLRTLFRRHQDKTKQEEMKKTGSAEESRRQDVKKDSKEETCSGLAGLVGLRYSRRFFLYMDWPFFEKHIFPPANEPREDKCENVTFGNASDLFKRFDRGLYLPIYSIHRLRLVLGECVASLLMKIFALKRFSSVYIQTLILLLVCYHKREFLCYPARMTHELIAGSVTAAFLIVTRSAVAGGIT